jgi:hypothetical protein
MERNWQNLLAHLLRAPPHICRSSSNPFFESHHGLHGKQGSMISQAMRK